MSRKNPEDRKNQIIDTALVTARHDGLYTMTLKSIARKCGISHPTIVHYFGNTQALRKAVIQKAMDVTDVRVVIMAILKDSNVLKDLSEDQKIIIMSEFQTILGI